MMLIFIYWRVKGGPVEGSALRALGKVGLDGALWKFLVTLTPRGLPR